MTEKKQERLFTQVTSRGEILFSDNNRDGQNLLPDIAKPAEETKQFYRSMAEADKEGRLFVPELRDARNAHDYYLGLDQLRAKVHEKIGTVNPPPRQFTPGMIALAKRLSAELEAKREAAFNERFKPEWRDFEKRFRNQMENTLEKLNGLPPEIRAQTEDKIRERFRQDERETAELEKNEPDFYNPSTQGKHMSLVEFLHFDADQIAKKALETHRAKDLADQYKAREASAGNDHDRER
jgi:hypothetical protein